MRLVSLTLFAFLTTASVVAGHSAFVPTGTAYVALSDTTPYDSALNRHSADSVRQNQVTQITRAKADSAVTQTPAVPRMPRMANDTLKAERTLALPDSAVAKAANDSTAADSVKPKNRVSIRLLSMWLRTPWCTMPTPNLLTFMVNRRLLT